MASPTFTDIAQVGSKDRDDGSFLVQVSGGVSANAVVYSGILNEDVDGAPRCYGRFPFDAGIDRLKYATNLVGGGMFNELPKGQLESLGLTIPPAVADSMNIPIPKP